MFAATMKWMQRAQMLPQLSETEKVAMEAGSIWMDAELFSGNPDMKKIMSEGYDDLTQEEREFLEGPCEELCRMVDAWEVIKTRKASDEIMNFMADNGFYALNMPKPWGKGFSALGKSTVMTKLTALPSWVSTLVVIPNSLGASELIARYGTDQQKEHYLPKLVSGEMYPCFGLTEPTAGSDAASIKAEAVVFKDDDGELKFRLNFRKRYITCAPVANLISLACKVHDPDNLLGKGENLGITVVLMEKGAKGLEIGNHHDPMGLAFPNGPIVGQDVVTSVDDVIGGRDQIGNGWRMLMECLSGGRAVSLPAGGVGGAKGIAAVAGAYSMVRQQFGLSIGHMEAIQTPLAKIASMAYALDAARIYSCTSINNGHKPAVISAVMKAYSTEVARELATDAMDIFAGSGVMAGPNNIIQAGYVGAPIGITVEGANIMTRTLIIFGQGATRCHPYALKVIRAVEDSNVGEFRGALLGWIGHMVKTRLRVTARGLTRGWTYHPARSPLAKYYRRIGWASARFALLTDRAMLLIGGTLKRKGALTGRFADVLSWMFIAISTLRRFEAEGSRKEDVDVARWALDYCMTQIQDGFEGIYENWDAPMGRIMRTIGRRWVGFNTMAHRPTDKESAKVAATIQKLDDQYLRLTQDMYRPSADEPGAGRLLNAFKLVNETAPIAKKVQKAIYKKKLPKLAGEELLTAAVAAGVITEAESTALHAAETARLGAIEVDVFTPEEYRANTVTQPAEPQLQAA